MCLIGVPLGSISTEPGQRRRAHALQRRDQAVPTWPEFKRIIPSALRGSVVGFFLGILPGGGLVIAQFAAYAPEG